MIILSLTLLFLVGMVDVSVSTEAPLLLMGKQFPLDLMGGEFTIHGQPLLIREQSNMGLGTGTTVWDGSIMLAKYLEARYSTMSGMRVVEVGSGPGVAGIAAAVLGASVILTDLNYALPNLRATVDLNSHLYKDGGKPLVGELDWFSPERCLLPGILEAQLIVGADVVWIEDLIGPLVRTLAFLSRGEVPVVLAHQTRSTRGDELLFSELKAVGFEVTSAPKDTHHPHFSSDNINILLLKPHPNLLKEL
jgi:predicted nicotinamide N-methyase